VAGGALAFAAVSSLPPLYTGEARVLVGLQGPRVLNVEAVIADVSPDAERVQNESYILQSRQIAAQVIDELHLDRSPAFDPEPAAPTFWGKYSLARLDREMPDWLGDWLRRLSPSAEPAAPPTEAQRRDKLIDRVLASVDVATLGRSHVLSVKAEAPDRELAAAIATRDARVQNVAEVDRIVTEFTSARSTADVVAALGRVGVPAAEVRNPGEAVRDPQVVARGETVRLTHPAAPDADVYGPGVPIVFSGSTVGLDQPPPGIGEHNREVYRDLLGYTHAELRELEFAGVI
jgi:hypothetical protein